MGKFEIDGAKCQVRVPYSVVPPNNVPEVHIFEVIRRISDETGGRVSATRSFGGDNIGWTLQSAEYTWLGPWTLKKMGDMFVQLMKAGEKVWFV